MARLAGAVKSKAGTFLHFFRRAAAAAGSVGRRNLFTLKKLTLS
jgi:hypothetical protein